MQLTAEMLLEKLLDFVEGREKELATRDQTALPALHEYGVAKAFLYNLLGETKSFADRRTRGFAAPGARVFETAKKEESNADTGDGPPVA